MQMNTWQAGRKNGDTVILASKREPAPSGADWKIWKDDNPPVSPHYRPLCIWSF